MAARKRRGTKENGWDQGVRDRIRAGVMWDRLFRFVMGEIYMTPTQVRSAQAMLDRVMPNLRKVRWNFEEAERYVISSSPDGDCELSDEYLTDLAQGTLQPLSN